MALRVVLLAIVAMTAFACNVASDGAKRAASSAGPAAGGYLGSLGDPGCRPGPAFHGLGGPGGQPEVGLDSATGSIWALFFNPVPPTAGNEIKVVWRMTGSADFSFRVSDAAGTTAPLAWGPEPHGGSNWNRPGNEVGTGFNFPHAGCWDIHVTKGNASADLWLQVID
jgi:hypothetical protein